MPDVALLYGWAAGDVLTDAASSASGVVFEIAPRALCSLFPSESIPHGLFPCRPRTHTVGTRALAVRNSVVPLESAF